MRSNRFSGALEATAALLDTQWDNAAVCDRLALLEELETLRRRTTALSHEVIDSLAREEVTVLGDVADRVIADRLRISPADARRRIRDAGQLTPQLTLVGEPLAPELPTTAEHWWAGILDGEHLTVIQRFFRRLPDHMAADVCEASEAFLAGKATVLRPDQLAKAADRLATYVNPDGVFSDADRARKRGFTWGRRGPDGMSQGRLPLCTPGAGLPSWLRTRALRASCWSWAAVPPINVRSSTGSRRPRPPNATSDHRVDPTSPTRNSRRGQRLSSSRELPHRGR